MELLTLGNALFFLIISAVIIVVLLATFIFWRFGKLLSGVGKVILMMLLAFVMISLLIGIIDVPNNVTSFVIKALETRP